MMMEQLNTQMKNKKNNPHLIEKQLKMDHGLKRNQKTKQNKTLMLQNFQKKLKGKIFETLS